MSYFKSPYVSAWQVGGTLIQRRRINGWHVGIWRSWGWTFIDAGRWRFEVIR